MKIHEVRNHWWTFGSGGMPKRYRLAHITTVGELADACDLVADRSITTYLRIDQGVLAQLAQRVLALEARTP